MEIRPIRNDEDHTEALKEIERLLGAAVGTPDGDKLDVLVTLVDAYEEKRWPIPESTPLEVLHYAITEMGRSQAELARLLGSRSRASEILAGKRRISLEVAQKVSNAWHIPIELLVQPYELEVA